VLLAWLEIQVSVDHQGSLAHLGLLVLPVTLVRQARPEQLEPLERQDQPEVLATLAYLVRLVPVGLQEQLVLLVAVVIQV